MNNIELYKANEVLENKYYQIPQELFFNERYKDKLNSDSKILYAFLLDRLTLSIKNKWINENGEVYLIFTRQEVQEKLNLSDKTVSKAFRQLTDTQLIYEKRQGLGKPNLLFVGKIQHQNNLAEPEELRFQSRKNYDSGEGEITIQEPENLRAINTNNNNTNIIKTNSILSHLEKVIYIDEMSRKDYEELFKANIEYDKLVQEPKNAKLIEDIKNIVVETLISKKEYINIAKERKPIEVVKAQLLKLKSYHIQYVIASFEENRSEIRNKIAYLLTTLYNAIHSFHLDVALGAAMYMNTYDTEFSEVGIC